MHGIGVLILMLSGCLLIIVSLLSAKWLYYCPHPAICAHTGLLKTNEYCNSDSRCVDALQYGVFAILCGSLLCRTGILYTAIDTMYHRSPTHVNGNIVLMDGLLTITALYTAFLVAHLKLSGNESSSVHDLRWPFYITVGGLFLAPLAFYIQGSPKNENNFSRRYNS